MNMNHYVKFSCWTSIVLILWGLITGIFEPTWTTIAPLIFFLLMALCAWAVGR